MIDLLDPFIALFGLACFLAGFLTGAWVIPWACETRRQWRG